MSEYRDNLWAALEDLGDGVSGKCLVRTRESRLVDGEPLSRRFPGDG